MPSDPLWPQLLLQVVLIALNAFFASAEIALLSVNENVLRHQAEEGDKRAAKLLNVVKTPTRFLSTIQIGITLAGFLGSAFAADNFASRITYALTEAGFTALPMGAINTLAVIVITIVLSFFTLVFGELVPKRVAMQRADQVARTAAGVISVLAAVLRPAIWLLSVCTNGVLRILRIDPDAEDNPVSEDEIRMMVDIGEEKGAIQRDEREMIENIFEFNNTTAEDVMCHRTDMVLIWEEDSPEEILHTIESSGLSRFPVCREDADDVIGTLTTRSYLLNAQRKEPKPLKDLIRPAYFVPESVRTDVLFRDMQNKKVHMAIVVDEYGGTAGLVTMEDLLEEIVGNIYDEFDPQDEQEIIPLGENLWRVSGAAELEELAEVIGFDLPTGEEELDYDTVGGLVFAQLSVIPEDGSQVEVDALGLHIKVEKIEDRRVEWALVSKLPAAEENDKAHNG